MATHPDKGVQAAVAAILSVTPVPEDATSLQILARSPDEEVASMATQGLDKLSR
jgi:hypothetical protein